MTVTERIPCMNSDPGAYEGDYCFVLPGGPSAGSGLKKEKLKKAGSERSTAAATDISGTGARAPEGEKRSRLRVLSSASSR